LRGAASAKSLSTSKKCEQTNNVAVKEHPWGEKKTARKEIRIQGEKKKDRKQTQRVWGTAKKLRSKTFAVHNWGRRGEKECYGRKARGAGEGGNVYGQFAESEDSHLQTRRKEKIERKVGKDVPTAHLAEGPRSKPQKPRAVNKKRNKWGDNVEDVQRVGCQKISRNGFAI